MRHLLIAALLWVSLVSAGSPHSPASFVDPLIGTAGDGQTYPATGVPFGMTQWTPETRTGETKCIAPYYHKDTRIRGFRGTHFLSGSCVQDYGSVSLMPVAGDTRLDAESRSSAFSHTAERATPFRYDVTLADSGIAASLTGTLRAGFLRFQFPAGRARVVIDANARAGEGEIVVDPERREVRGSNPVHRLYAGAGKLAGFSGYFVARFSQPFRTHGKQSETAAWVEFEDNGGQTILVKVGTSFVSMDAARSNLDAEIPAWDFDRTVSDAAAAWNQALGKIEVSGREPSRRQVFYTALYHSMLAPRTFSDADGSYPRFAGGGRTEIAKGFTYYCDFSLWDTFRSLHPLMTIIDPARTADMMQSLVAKGTQGGWLPIFPAWNSYTQEMIGDHAAVAIADAYIKGIRGFDIDEAWRLIRQNATQSPASKADYVDGRGRRALDSYLRYGFIPLEDPVNDAFHKGEQVSRTLEYAYDDFVVGELAAALGKPEDAATFHRRSQNYRNVIDPTTGFARGRHADGAWSEPFDPTKPYPYITEGLPYQYTFFVPHDMAGLIALLGGRESFIAKLDGLFAGGSYDHGNEPSHHIAYLYDFAGAPWKTQERVHTVMRQKYTEGPAGLAGNEDGGQMSAWYVLSAMGIYPVAPGVAVYQLGTPDFDSVTIHTQGGKLFTVRAPGVSEGRFYIQSAKLNGRPLDHPWLRHEDLVQGGLLELKMGTAPNRNWAPK